MAARATPPDVHAAMAWLTAKSSRRVKEGMARYGIPSDHAMGVSIRDIQAIAKRVGRNHDLAAALWKTGIYEARLLTSWVDEPERVTSAQMDRWCRDFDNWGIVDTVCFSLFDRVPHAWSRAAAWSRRRPEFERRAGFVLMACLALHDKAAPDARFAPFLKLIETGAKDDRNFVKKGVSWALRSIGRRNPALRAASVKVATRLAASTSDAARWVGKDTLRDLRAATKPARSVRS